MNFSSILPFIYQLKNSELLEIYRPEKLYSRENLIGRMIEDLDPEELLNALRKAEIYVSSRRKKGKCINPYTGNLIKIDGPTYNNLSESYKNPILPECVNDLYKVGVKIIAKVEKEGYEGLVGTDIFSRFPDEILLLTTTFMDQCDLRKFCILNKKLYLLSQDETIQNRLINIHIQNNFDSAYNINGWSYTFIDKDGKLYVWGPDKNKKISFGAVRKNIWIPQCINTVTCGTPRYVNMTKKNLFVINNRGEIWVTGSLGCGVLRRPFPKKSTSIFLKIRFDNDIRFAQVIGSNFGYTVGLSNDGEIYAWGGEFSHYSHECHECENHDIIDSKGYTLHHLAFPEKIVKILDGFMYLSESGTCYGKGPPYHGNVHSGKNQRYAVQILSHHWREKIMYVFDDYIKFKGHNTTKIMFKKQITSTNGFVLGKTYYICIVIEFRDVHIFEHKTKTKEIISFEVDSDIIDVKYTTYSKNELTLWDEFMFILVSTDKLFYCGAENGFKAIEAIPAHLEEMPHRRNKRYIS